MSASIMHACPCHVIMDMFMSAPCAWPYMVLVMCSVGMAMPSLPIPLAIFYTGGIIIYSIFRLRACAEPGSASVLYTKSILNSQPPPDHFTGAKASSEGRARALPPTPPRDPSDYRQRHAGMRAGLRLMKLCAQGPGRGGRVTDALISL